MISWILFLTIMRLLSVSYLFVHTTWIQRCEHKKTHHTHCIFLNLQVSWCVMSRRCCVLERQVVMEFIKKAKIDQLIEHFYHDTPTHQRVAWY